MRPVDALQYNVRDNENVFVLGGFLGITALISGLVLALVFQLTRKPVEEMQLNPGQMGPIVNRAPGGVLNEGIREEIEKHGLKLFGVLPHDDEVYRCDCEGEPSAKLPENDAMKSALKGIMAEIGL